MTLRSPIRCCFVTVIALFLAAGMGMPACGEIDATAKRTPSEHSQPVPEAAAVPTAQTESASQNMDLVLGRSVFLKTAYRLRRVYVSNPAVLQCFTASPYEVVVTAKAAGVSSLALWDNAGHSQLYTVSANLDVEALRRSLRESLPGEDIQATSQEGKIYLTGSVLGEAAYDEAFKLASQYSKDVVNSLFVTPVHGKQVQLKVRIVEVDRTKLNQYGFNFFSNGRNTASVSTQQFSSVGPLPNNSTAKTVLGVTNPLNFFLYNSDLNIGMTIADLEQRNILQVLAEPTITTMSGHEAKFLSGGEFPYPVIQGGAGNFASVTIMFEPYGVKLDFTPTVNPDGSIRLKVKPEVSALDYSNAVTISGYTIPAISTRRAETEIELRSGQSFRISGLLDHRTTEILSKVPGIGSVPVLGQFFRSKNFNHSVVELVVIVTATVVDPLTDRTQPAAPKMAVPNLDIDQFDSGTKSAGKKKRQP